MPKGIKGYRWIETGYSVWMLEHPSGSRRFLGVVSCTGDEDIFVWWTTEGRFHGEKRSSREAMTCVEKQTIPDRQMILRGRKQAMEILKKAKIGPEEKELIIEQNIQNYIVRQ